MRTSFDKNYIYMRYIPNILSLIRIPLSLRLLLFVSNYYGFMILYFLCGLSDILDGYVARRMNLQSTRGAKLDSLADLIMYTVVIIMLCLWDFNALADFIPFLMPVALLRGANIGIMYRKFYQLGAIHTIGNKIVGLLIYCIPFIYILQIARSDIFRIFQFVFCYPRSPQAPRYGYNPDTLLFQEDTKTEHKDYRSYHVRQKLHKELYYLLSGIPLQTRHSWF